MNLRNALLRRGSRLLGQGRRARLGPTVWQNLLELSRSGPAPLVPGSGAFDGRMRVAVVIPPFRRGSGGHATIVRLAHQLTRLGHEISLWLDDCEGRHAREPGRLVVESFGEFFDARDLSFHPDFGSWSGADVVVATGWQTVPRVMLLPEARSRAYLVQDHEPDFYAASAERLAAQATYRQKLHCIAASEWLAGLLHERYGADATHFDLGVDHDVYRRGTEPRRSDLVVFYGRAVTPRRAVPLGFLALEELARRRPDIEIALFGDLTYPDAPFRHTRFGVLDPAGLAQLYARATVGMVFSLTNPSLVGLEMMACGLPCVELATEPNIASFGSDAALMLCEPEPLAVCSAIERLLDDPGERERRSAAGVAFTAGRTWRWAAEQIEQALRAVLEAA